MFARLSSTIACLILIFTKCLHSKSTSIQTTINNYLLYLAFTSSQDPPFVTLVIPLLSSMDFA